MTEANQRVSVTEAYNDSCVIQQIRGLKDSKQDKLTAGTNITISSENVISSADAKAQWGQITGSIGSQTDLQTALAAKADTSALAAKQNVLTAGQNITIVNDVISATGELSVAWGSISGSISDQTDLQSALNAKASTSALTAHTSDVSNPHSVTKAQVGLGNVDNTSDADKPVSTATQTALNAKASTSALTAHTSNTSNPHSVSKAQVGLGNVDNTSDADKPISTAVQTALDALPKIRTGTVSFTTPAGVTLTRATFTFTDIGTTDYSVILTPLYALSGFGELIPTTMSRSTSSCEVAVWNRSSSAASTITYMITIIAT